MQIFCLKVQKKTTISRLFWVTSRALAHLPLATKNYYVVKVAATVRSPQKNVHLLCDARLFSGTPLKRGGNLAKRHNLSRAHTT